MTKKQEHEVLFSECCKNYEILRKYSTDNDNDDFTKEFRTIAVTLDLVIAKMGLSDEFFEYKRERYKKENA